MGNEARRKQRPDNLISPRKPGKLHKLLSGFALMTPWTPDQKLETPRLILRSPTPADLPALAQIYANPAVAQFSPSGVPLDRKQSEIALEIILAHWTDHGFGRWMLWRKAEPPQSNPQLIGHAGLEVSPNQQAIELNYLLAPEYWGHGLATEANREILRYGFEVLKLPRIAALINPENKTSIRVAQKLGMAYSNDIFLYEKIWRYYSLRPQPSLRPNSS